MKTELAAIVHLAAGFSFGTGNDAIRPNGGISIRFAYNFSTFTDAVAQ